MDQREREIGIQFVEDRKRMPLSEAQRLQDERMADHFAELGIMRCGRIETLDNGKRLDSRRGALVYMWRAMTRR